MVNMNVQYSGPNPALWVLTRELSRDYGTPARAYEFVTGYKSPSNVSSHNADSRGIAHAVDIFVGPGNLTESQGIHVAEQLRLEGKRGVIPGHPDRLAYIIHRGRIAGDHTGWEWVAYTGSDWHGDHIHVSAVFDYYWGDPVPGNPDDYNSTAPWNLSASAIAGQSSGIEKIIESIQEDTLSTQEVERIIREVGIMLEQYHAVTRAVVEKVPAQVVEARFTRVGTDGKAGGQTTLAAVLGTHDANVVLTRGVVTGAAEAVAKTVAAVSAAPGIDAAEQGRLAAAAFLAEVGGLHLTVVKSEGSVTAEQRK